MKLSVKSLTTGLTFHGEVHGFVVDAG